MAILVDLHNHSCLSPCASLELSPSRLARLARERGIGILGLSDHNAALNCPAFAIAAEREGLAPLFGIEACSAEEVHVLCVFASAAEALDFGQLLRGLLPPLPYDPEKLGDQVVVDEDEGILELPDYYLGAALELGYDELCREAAARGALVIPAHIDRPYFSVSSQLGFLPPFPYAALESMREPPQGLAGAYPLVSGSDAHAPEQIGRRPFGIELGARAAALRGAELLSALREALAAGLAQPSWRRQG